MTTQDTRGSAEVAPVRPGEELDWAALERWLRTELPELSGPFSVLQFPNGSANLTYQVQFGDRRLVVRRPPFGQLAPGAHDMRREHRVLSRLYRAYDRAPRAFAFCSDEMVIGAPFFVMEYRPGIVVWNAIPESMSGLPDAGRRVGFAVVDALADLHRVDPAACDLADLGRPEGFVQRQLNGWSKRWELVAPEGGEPVAERLRDRLQETLPTSGRAAILHNDFKIDNCQFSPDNPDRVVSVFDWDMATLGDPLVDLGTLLNYWPDGDRAPAALASLGLEHLGLPTHAEVIERYRERTGADVSEIAWYVAYGGWKTVVILQQLYNRFVRGETTDPRMGDRGKLVAPLARQALAVLGEPVPA